MKNLKKTINSIVAELIENTVSRLGNKIESINIVGSYAIGKYSLQAPNVNFEIISKPNESPNLYLPLSEIFLNLIEKFKKDINIFHDLKPYRQTLYLPIKNKITLTINTGLLDLRDIKRNFDIPAYVLRGWIDTRKVIYGKDVLGKLKVEVKKNRVLVEQKRFVLLTIKKQLEKVPYTYDWHKYPELLFEEALTFSKLLLFEGVLLRMHEKEIEKKLDLEVISDKEKLADFYTKRFNKEVGRLARKVINMRKNYLKLKSNIKKALELYKIDWRLWNLIWKKFQKWSTETRLKS